MKNALNGKNPLLGCLKILLLALVLKGSFVLAGDVRAHRVEDVVGGALADHAEAGSCPKGDGRPRMRRGWHSRGSFLQQWVK